MEIIIDILHENNANINQNKYFQGSQERNIQMYKNVDEFEIHIKIVRVCLDKKKYQMHLQMF